MTAPADETVEGTWFDGNSSRGRAVRLGLAAPGVLRLASDQDVTLWPLDEVEFSPRLGSTPRMLRREGHGQLECPDGPLLERWQSRPSSRIEAFADWLERRRLAIAGAAVMTVAATVGFVHWGVPWLADGIARRIPPAVERHVSDQAVAVLARTGFRPSDVPEARQASLREAFAALVRDEPRADDMRLQFVDAGALGPNAFALPDGRIYLTDALVELAGSDDELLAVLAHEAGHHVHRHGMRGAIEGSSVFLAVGLLFGDVSGSSLAVAVPAVLLTNGFSRGHEREADAHAFDLLQRRGRSPADFAAIMERLAQTMPRGMDEGPLGYLSTHPPSPERVAAARRAAGERVSPAGSDALQ